MPTPSQSPLPPAPASAADADHRPEFLLLSGSLREGSGNETLLRTAQALAPCAGVRAVRYEGLAELPHFNPDRDRDPLPEPVRELRAALARADALLVCTPEYAGTLPGAFKNLLDWTVGGTEICDKPAAWVNVAPPGRGEGAVGTLRTVLGYTGAFVVEEACLRIPVGAGATGPEGTLQDPETTARLIGLLRLLATATVPTSA